LKGGTGQRAERGRWGVGVVLWEMALVTELEEQSSYKKGKGRQ
jgi:hypothetical protein